MSLLEGSSALVIGAGAFGLASAVRLQLAGARTLLVEAAPLGDSASGVAAGMLAPGLESVLDSSSHGLFQMLRDARDRWPHLLALIGAPEALIDRSGALFLAETSDAAESLRGRLTAEGAEVEALEGASAEALAPGLRVGDARPLYLPGEWRLSPDVVLACLAEAFRAAGGRVQRARVTADASGLRTEAGARLGADVVVVATGADVAGLSRIAPVLARLEPIKGQILRMAGGPRAGPVVRTARAYIAPQPAGALAGATMEHGLSDRRIDPVALSRIRAEAERLFPELRGVDAHGHAGVRASAPDGLPLVGRAGAGGPILAVGARRNGWLLAPLVAELVLKAAAGEGGGAVGERLSPDRFAV